MAKTDELDIRDIRDSKFLWIDKGALQVINKSIGAIGVAVYTWLCYHASTTEQDCFPSITTLAGYCRANRHSIIRALKELQKIGIIKIAKGKGRSNTYSLLNPPVDKTVDSTAAVDAGSASRSTGVVPLGALPVVPVEALEQDSIERYSTNNNTIAEFFSNPDPDWLQKMKEAFPKVNVDAELKKMHAWLVSNPDRAKKNLKRFAMNWLSHEKEAVLKGSNPKITGWLGGMEHNKIDESYLNDALGKLATQDRIKSVLRELPQSYWFRVSAFLAKRYPQDGYRAFGEAERAVIAEARQGQEKVAEMTAGIGH